MPIPYAKHEVTEADIEAVVQALRSDFVTQGPRVAWFEDALREATGAAHAVVVSSGTAALRIACQSLSIGAGDRGIVPAITFAATANCLRQVGAQVGFADVRKESGLSGASEYAAAFEAPAKIVLPVTYSGRSYDLEAIAALARQHGAYVVEDAAHSLGGSWKDASGALVKSGSCRYSDAATLSFHPAKHICSGEGGALLTNDAALARRARRLRTHGIEKLPERCDAEGGWFYQQLELGDNSRMTEPQAALGLSQLRRLERMVERRRELACAYHAAFSQKPVSVVIELPEPDPLSAWHLYAVRLADPARRRPLYDFLHERGVYAQVHYIPVYRHPYYQAEGHPALPGAEDYYSRCLSLPLYSSLSDADQRTVIEAVAAFCA